MCLFLTNMQLLSSPDVNWWSGVMWIIVMFLSDSHSDGTHSLQSIHCWDTDAVLHFSKSDEESNSSTSCMTWGWEHLHFLANYFHHCPLHMYIWDAHLLPSCSAQSRRWLCPSCTWVSPRPGGWLNWTRCPRGCFWARSAGCLTSLRSDEPWPEPNPAHSPPDTGICRHLPERSG